MCEEFISNLSHHTKSKTKFGQPLLSNSEVRDESTDGFSFYPQERQFKQKSTRWVASLYYFTYVTTTREEECVLKMKKGKAKKRKEKKRLFHLTQFCCTFGTNTGNSMDALIMHISTRSAGISSPFGRMKALGLCVQRRAECPRRAAHACQEKRDFRL